MRPPDGVPDPGSSATRLSRLVGAVAGGGWTPSPAASQAPAAGSDELGAGWRSTLLAASPQALLWLLAAGLAVVLVTGFVMQRHSGRASAPVASSPAGDHSTSGAPSTSAAGSLVVDVGGRVRHPGLVTLPLGARVADAIAAAGGALRRRDLAAINLAGRVADGQFLVVGAPGGVAGGTTAAGGGGGGLVSLNNATVDQLDALPGVGPVLAQRIVDWRQAHGGFASVDQLQQVSGIGARKYDDLKALVSP